jgi:hypothetical protein
MYSLPSPEVLLGAANLLLFWANGLQSAAVQPRPELEMVRRVKTADQRHACVIE